MTPDLNRYEAFIFDLDGTLIDSEKYHADGFAQAVEALSGYRLTPAEPHHFAVLMGALNDELKAHAEGKLPNSYRQWEEFQRIARPQAVRNVLNDDFPRIDKSRPPFRPTQPIEAR